MEASKKRRAHGETTSSSANEGTSKRPTRGESAVTDEEVDEFFSILRKAKEIRRRLTWQPVFTLDDFQVATNGRDGATVERDLRRKAEVEAAAAKAADSRNFDLNEIPDQMEITDG